MANAKVGWGGELKMDNSSGVLTEVMEIIELGVPNDQVDEVEATHFKSPQKRREYIPGLIDGGELAISINYIAGSPTDLLLTEAKNSGTVRDIEIIIPNATLGWKIATSVIVKGYEKNIPIDDRMTATATMRVTGAVTESAVTA